MKVPQAFLLLVVSMPLIQASPSGPYSSSDGIVLTEGGPEEYYTSSSNHDNWVADNNYQYGRWRRYNAERASEAQTVQRAPYLVQRTVNEERLAESGAPVMVYWWASFPGKEELIHKMAALWHYHIEPNGHPTEKGRQSIVCRIRLTLTLDEANYLLDHGPNEQYVQFILHHAAKDYRENDLVRISKKLRIYHDDVCKDMPVEEYVKYALEEEKMRGLEDQWVMERVMQRIINGPDALEQYEVEKWRNTWA